MAEGFVILDDVFVPNERIFLDGAVAQAAVFAHSLGLWERLGGLSAMAEEADQLVGFAQLISEAHGLPEGGHGKEKNSEVLIHADLICPAVHGAVPQWPNTDQRAFPHPIQNNG